MIPLLIALTVVRGLLYVVVVPPWQAPDEIAHFEYARLLAAYRRPLTPGDASPELEREILNSLYEFDAWRYVYRPTPEPVPTRLSEEPFFGRSRTLSRFSLAYVPYAFAAWPLIDQKVVIQLFAMRIVSIILGAVVIVLAFKTARLVEPNSPELAVGTALFIVFLPQHTFIMSSVNDGNLAELLASAVIYLLVKILRSGLTWERAIGGLLCGSLAVLTKATTYFLIPLMMIVGLITIRRWYDFGQLSQGWQKGWLAWLAALIGAAFLTGIPLTLRYLAPSQAAYIESNISSNVRNLSNFVVYLFSLNTQGMFSDALWGTFKSFWATFGWMILPLPESWYQVLLVLSTLSLIGWGLRFKVRSWQRERVSSYPVIGLAAVLSVAVVVAWFVASPNGLYYSQGRYLFGGIIPLAMLFVRGWLALAPARYAGRALWAIVIGMVLLDTAALLNVVVPFFYFR